MVLVAAVGRGQAEKSPPASVSSVTGSGSRTRRTRNWAPWNVARWGLPEESGAAVSVTYIRTSWSNFTLTRNLNVTPADFDPYCIPVPADSRLPLSGQTLCGLYAVSAAKFAVQNTNNLIIPVSGVSEKRCNAASYNVHTDPVTQFPAVNAIRTAVIGEAPYPNWTAVGVNWLAGFDFEIKVIARLPASA